MVGEHVVAGVIIDRDGRALLTQRPAGRHLAHLWEFPGGKRESGEASAEALRRELDEELGIVVGAMGPLISIPWHYPEKFVRLEVFRVHEYGGTAQAREGQRLCWVQPEQMLHLPMPPADRPVVAALRLPTRYVITPEPAQSDVSFLAALSQVLAEGARFILLRSKQRSDAELRPLAIAARRLTEAAGAQLLLNDRVSLVKELGLAGVHLSAQRLRSLAARPLELGRWVGASCHDAAELAHALRIGADFAVLGPVRPTRSHPASQPLGWRRFRALVAAAALPVYALGGVGPADLARARALGAIGIAGISAFWPRV